MDWYDINDSSLEHSKQHRYSSAGNLQGGKILLRQSVIATKTEARDCNGSWTRVRSSVLRQYGFPRLVELPLDERRIRQIL